MNKSQKIIESLEVNEMERAEFRKKHTNTEDTLFDVLHDYIMINKDPEVMKLLEKAKVDFKAIEALKKSKLLYKAFLRTARFSDKDKAMNQIFPDKKAIEKLKDEIEKAYSG